MLTRTLQGPPSVEEPVIADARPVPRFRGFLASIWVVISMLGRLPGTLAEDIQHQYEHDQLAKKYYKDVTGIWDDE